MEKRWLKTGQAVTYSSLGARKLKELALIGVIRGHKDPSNKRGDWFFDRLSIDAYINNMLDSDSPVSPQKKALDILSRL